MITENKFSQFLYELVEASRWQNVYDEEPKKQLVTTKKKVFWIFKKKVVEEVGPTRVDVTDDLLSKEISRYTYLFSVDMKYIKDFSNKKYRSFTRACLTFRTLWDFCEFVKLAEFMIFYPNTPESQLYIKANDYEFGNIRKDDETITMIIKVSDSVKITVQLESVEEKYSGKSLNAIKITINRNWISKPETIICIDEISDDNIGKIDEVFLSNINDIIYDQCYNLFKDIINSVLAESGVKLE